jgi:photosystem II stability/assembly factor-like uncharacterized protein
LYARYKTGNDWIKLGAVTPGNVIKHILMVSKSRLILNSWNGHEGSIHLSTDSGHTFREMCDKTGNGEILFYDKHAKLLYAAALHAPHLLTSTDLGETWSLIPTADSSRLSHVCAMFAMKSQGRLQFFLSSSEPGEVLCSDDTGKHWITVLAGKHFWGRELPAIAGTRDELALCTTDSDDSTGVNCYTSDSGRSLWHPHANGFPAWAIDIDKKNSNRICMGYFGPSPSEKNLAYSNRWTAAKRGSV